MTTDDLQQRLVKLFESEETNVASLIENLTGLTGVPLCRTQVRYAQTLAEDRIGRGDLLGALSAIKEVLVAIRYLTQNDVNYPWVLPGISLSIGKLGGRLAERDDDANFRNAYEESLTVGRDLVAGVHGSLGWALGVEPNKVGHKQSAFDTSGPPPAVVGEGVEVAGDSTGNPATLKWARDVLESLQVLGDARKREGDFLGAGMAYEKSTEIARELGGLDPSDAVLAGTLAINVEKLGDVRMATGDLQGARGAYGESLRLRRDLLERHPGNPGLGRDILGPLAKLAEADPGNAAEYWAEVVARIEEMAARGTLLPTDAPYLETARGNLAATR